MKSLYSCPGMLAYQLPPSDVFTGMNTGAFQMLDSNGQTSHYVLGYLSHLENPTQQLYPLPPHANFVENLYAQHRRSESQECSAQTLHSWSSSAHSNQTVEKKSVRHTKPGKGFFSSGRGESGSWRQSKHVVSSDGASALNQETIRKTVYITDVDQQVTEEQLAAIFKSYGSVKDCRVCGDPNSATRFAFIEFMAADAAEKAISDSGVTYGSLHFRVLPSKTAIVPVNTQYLPKTLSEREQVLRTIYAANIDKKVDKDAVKQYFEIFCGPVNRIRLLGDWHHAARIAFVEFQNAESAKKALLHSGALLGSLQIRVSPSKTPVRDDTNRQD